MVKPVLVGLMLHLNVGEGRPTAGTPVDDIFPAVDETFLMQPDEHLPHCPGEPLIQGEPLAVPIARRPHAF